MSNTSRRFESHLSRTDPNYSQLGSLIDSQRNEETTMTHETLDLVELGQAEVLIEAGLPESEDEAVDKFIPLVAPYVEFE